MNQVAEARASNVKVDLLPKRTDMTTEEVRELVNAPTEEVVVYTKKELADYSDELDSLGLNGTIDLINGENNANGNGNREQEGGIGLALGKAAKRKGRQ